MTPVTDLLADRDVDFGGVGTFVWRCCLEYLKLGLYLAVAFGGAIGFERILPQRSVDVLTALQEPLVLGLLGAAVLLAPVKARIPERWTTHRQTDVGWFLRSVVIIGLLVGLFGFFRLYIEALGLEGFF